MCVRVYVSIFNTLKASDYCFSPSFHLPSLFPSLSPSLQAPPNDIFKEFDEDNAPADKTESVVA